MTELRRTESPPLPPDPRRASRPLTPPDSQQTYDSRSQRSTTSSKNGSRATSRSRPILHQPQPMRDVIDKAVGESSDQSPTDHHIDPEYISKIAELVAKELSRSDPSQATQYPPPPPPLVSTFQPLSPTLSSTASIPSRYTPPSPSKEKAGARGSDVGSPEPMFPEADFDTDDKDHINFDTDDKDHIHLTDDSRDDVTPTPYNNIGRSSRAESGTESLYKTQSNSSKRRVDSVPTSPTFSELDDVTAVEKAWEPLFDRDGHSLPRLGHFLRGLALHLIEDYEPKDSLVLTPAKMLRFFTETKVQDEQYPWQVIFSTSISGSSLSTLYQKLRAQHHLVQTENHTSPTVPALTPWGFESFMTTLIKAHPDHEYKRIGEAVKHMPVSSAENRKFRFPKELSRRLLPSKPNVASAQLLTASMLHEQRIQIKNPIAMPPPPPQPAQAPPVASPAIQIPERQRMPYARHSYSNNVDDDDLSGPPIQIERERKPYSSREGLGKHHESDSERDHRGYKPDDYASRPVRQNSGSSYAASSASDPRTIPRSRMPVGPGTNPPMSYNNIPRASGSSCARSDTGSFDNIHPASYSNAPRAASDYDDSDRRSARRQTLPTAVPATSDIDPRGKAIPPRVGQGSFDSGYGSPNMPPPLPPLGTSFPNPRSQALYEERRRSAYSAGPAPNMNDNWHPFANTGPSPQQQYYNPDSGR